MMNKVMLGSRESDWYLWRYHDDDFPWSATVELKKKRDDSDCFTKLFKTHWSRNKQNNFKLTFGRDRDCSPGIMIELPFLFFFTFSLPFLADRSKGEWKTGIEYFHQILWFRWFDRDDWSDDEPGFHWTWRWRRTFLGTFESEENVRDKEVRTITIPATKNYDKMERTVELKKYESVNYRSYFPFWKYRTEYVEVRCPDGIPHPGKGTTSYNIGEDALISTSYKTESYDEAIEHFIEDGLAYRDKYPK